MLGLFRRYGFLSVMAATVVATGSFQACGGDDDGGGGSGGKKDAGSDQSTTGGTGGGAGDAAPDITSCGPAGATCADGTDCCSGLCDPALNTCVNPGGCGDPGQSCTVGPDCCTGACTNGQCSSTQCVSDGKACTADGECCGQKCENSTCTPINIECKSAGNECGASSECCSKLCSGGFCNADSSFCTQTGDICIADTDCCTGTCALGSTNVGTCAEPDAPGTSGCLSAGSVCSDVAEDGGVILNDAGLPSCGGACCSRACAPYGPTGVLVCQPPSGCHPTGELCTKDSDCCGAPGVPGGNGSVHCSKGDPNQAVGRCDNGGSCRPAGAVCKLATGSCNAENNCCAGNVNQDPTVCKQDLLGIPRCTNPGSCEEAGSKAGQPCASSADCCGLPCLPNAAPTDAGDLFICGTSCVPAGGTCTTSADCCAGLPCTVPPGSTQGVCGTTTTDAGIPEGGTDAGTCSLYGQSCTTAADCCNGVPCTFQGEFGRCVYPVQ